MCFCIYILYCIVIYVEPGTFVSWQNFVFVLCFFLLHMYCDIFLYCIVLYLCCICIMLYLGEQKTRVSWNCVVFVSVRVFVIVIVIVCVFVFALCCIWGNRGQEWAGIGEKVGQCDGGAGWPPIFRLRGVSYNFIYSNISVDRPLPRHTWDI